MMKNKYCNHILEIIRKAKESKEWSISDYVTPLKVLYKSLNRRNKDQFNSSVSELFHGRIYIANLIDICRELRIQESCDELLRLLVNNPAGLKEDGHPVWIEGLLRNIIYTLGFLECANAVSVLKQLIDDKIKRKKTLPFNLSWDSYGVIIQALTNISPEEAGKCFGWWVMKSQEIDRKQIVFAKQLNDWKIMESLNIAPNIEDSIYGASSVRQCLIIVVQKNGLVGFKKWLSSITLRNEKDRNFLQKQIKILTDGTNNLFPNLKTLCNYKGESNILAKELSILPRVRSLDRIRDSS